MTVRLITEYQGTPAGARVSLGWINEQKLVAQGKATYNLDGSFAWPAIVDRVTLGPIGSVEQLTSTYPPQNYVGTSALVGSVAPFTEYTSDGATWFSVVTRANLAAEITAIGTKAVNYPAKAAGVLINNFCSSSGIAFSGSSGVAGGTDLTFPSPEGAASTYVSCPLDGGQGYARITLTQAVRFAATDTISFRVFVEDPSSLRYMQLAILQSSSGAALKVTITTDGVYDAGSFGWYTMDWKLSDASMVGTWNYGADATSFQFQFGGYPTGGGQGRAAISNLRKNAAAQAYVIFTQDRGYDSVETVKPIFAGCGVPLSVFVNASALDTAGQLTTEQAASLRNHPSRMFELASYPDYMPTLWHTTNGIALSQPVAGAGNLTLAGSFCTAGVANLGAARKVVLQTTPGGGNRLVMFTITGTLGGVSVSETLLGSWYSSGVESTYYYDTVTQIAVSAAITGNVTVGTSYSVAEHSAAIAAQIATMRAKGLTGAELFIAYPGGQISEPLKSAIDANNILLGRPNIHNQAAPRNMLLQDAAWNPYLLSAQNLGLAIASLKSQVDDIKNRGGVLVFYFHTIAASVDGSNPTLEDLAEIVAYCKGYENQGLLTTIKLSDLRRIYDTRTAI